jgi:hypothetical protein
MSWLGWVLIPLGGAVAFFIFTYFIGNPKFWRLVKEHPDEAYGLFLLSGCLVDKKPEKGTRSEYTGPFMFCTSDGTTHIVYIPADKIDRIQGQITDAITATDG